MPGQRYIRRSEVVRMAEKEPVILSRYWSRVERIRPGVGGHDDGKENSCS